MSSAAFSDLHQSILARDSDLLRTALLLESPTALLDGVPPLAWACMDPQPALVEILLHSGARVDQLSDQDGRRPIHFLFSSRQHLSSGTLACILDCLDLLRSHGADLDALDAQRRSPLTLALQARQPDLVRALLRLGASPDGAPDDTNTPLSSCVSSLGRADSLELARILLSLGAQVDLTRSGLTCLSLAARRGLTDFAELFLSAGADPNALDPHGRNPLLTHLLSTNPHSSMIRLLLEAGSDPLLADQDGLTALASASRPGLDRSLSLLIERSILETASAFPARSERSVAPRL